MSAHSLAAQLPTLLGGVNPAWLPFFDEHDLMGAARSALEQTEADAARLTPEPCRIFEFLRYFGPNDALVLIMSQNPHPRGAQGLSFSIAPEAPLDETLKSVVQDLETQGCARHHHRVKGDISSERVYCGDLRAWATQGVLLMNAALTDRVDASGAHRDCWKEFTTRFLGALSAHISGLGRPLICILWGADERALAPVVREANIYHSPPPSPHFKDANTALHAAGQRKVEWDPLGYTYAFTDGSCPRNGKLDAEASYAAYIITGPLKGVEARGRVEPREYALVDPDDPARGFAPVSDKLATPTNNRGEYLAWCWVLLLLLRGEIRGRIEVVSDCNLFIQTMEDWLPTRRKKGKAESLKNFDLVCIGEVLLAALRESCKGVKLTHIHSHQKRPPPEADEQARVFWYGNDRVDRAAGSLLADGGPDFELLTAPPLAWRIHGRYE